MEKKTFIIFIKYLDAKMTLSAIWPTLTRVYMYTTFYV